MVFRSVVFLFAVGFAAAQTPSVSAVVNAASYAGGHVAAGSMVSIFGSNLSKVTAVLAAPLPASALGVSVKVGTVSAPLQYISDKQINIQIPWELAGAGSVPLTVTSNGATSSSQSVTIAPSAPGVFSAVAAASGTAQPVRRGEYLKLYVTGLGDVTNKPASGANATSAKMSLAQGQFAVLIAGQPAAPAFAGLSPYEPLGIDSVGLYEIDVQVPLTATLGESVPVAVSGGGTASNTVTVAIRKEDPQQVLSAWTQYGPDGLTARAIISGTVCPAITIDGKDQPMPVRAKPSLPLYPVQSCEIAIPASAGSAAIGTVSLPLPNPDLKKITIIGDTGCRLDATRIQACNDLSQWPTPVVAATAATTSPDLIIQLGDYHYREVPCPPGNAGCAATPWGYNWYVWNLDFFTPMTPALAAAPQVIIRGNHEQCSRAGEGWFRFLDPRPLPATCQLYNDPYTVQAGPTQLFVIDSSEATDTTAAPELVAQFAPYFQQLNAVVTGNTWVLMHHPMWGFDSTGTRNLSLQTASQNTLPSGVQMVLSGHIHTFQTLTFSLARPPQMIAGNGGDVLQAYAATTTGFTGMTIGGAGVTDSRLYKDFGFTTMEWTGDSWAATARDVYGTPVMNCTVANSAIACQ